MTDHIEDNAASWFTQWRTNRTIEKLAGMKSELKELVAVIENVEKFPASWVEKRLKLSRNIGATEAKLARLIKARKS